MSSLSSPSTDGEHAQRRGQSWRLRTERTFSPADPPAARASISSISSKTYVEPASAGSRLLHCPDCVSVFTRHSSLRRHQESAHDGDRWECPDCRKAFWRRDYARQHARRLGHGQAVCVSCKSVPRAAETPRPSRRDTRRYSPYRTPARSRSPRTRRSRTPVSRADRSSRRKSSRHRYSSSNRTSTSRAPVKRPPVRSVRIQVDMDHVETCNSTAQTPGYAGAFFTFCPCRATYGPEPDDSARTRGELGPGGIITIVESDGHLLTVAQTVKPISIVYDYEFEALRTSLMPEPADDAAGELKLFLRAEGERNRRGCTLPVDEQSPLNGSEGPDTD